MRMTMLRRPLAARPRPTDMRARLSTAFLRLSTLYGWGLYGPRLRRKPAAVESRSPTPHHPRPTVTHVPGLKSPPCPRSFTRSPKPEARSPKLGARLDWTVHARSGTRSCDPGLSAWNDVGRSREEPAGSMTPRRSTH